MQKLVRSVSVTVYPFRSGACVFEPFAIGIVSHEANLAKRMTAVYCHVPSYMTPRQRAVSQAAAVLAPGKGARAAAARAAAAAASPVAAVPAPAAAAPAPAGPSLRGLQRGSVAVVSLPGTYGAGKEYNFADVCRIGEAIEKETITLADLSKKDADGKWLHTVPRTTMLGWLADDEVRRKGLGFERGIPGQPYWKVDMGGA